MVDKNLEEWISGEIQEEQVAFFDDIEIKRTLGSNTFGRVYEARLKGHSPNKVAVKIFRKIEMEEPVDEKRIEDFLRELQFLRSLRDVENHCPNILRFYGISKAPDAKTYMLVLEYADGGSLREYLEKNFDKLAGSGKLRLATEIAAGVSCLHENDIIHRDLNSVSILVHQGHIKIADLGLSKKLEVKQIDTNKSEAKARHLQYVDPQYYLTYEFTRTQKSDIYSLGVIFWELTSGRVPYLKLGGAPTIIGHIVRNGREEKIDGTPQAFVDLYTKCWEQKPEERPEILEVCEALGEIEW